MSNTPILLIVDDDSDLLDMYREVMQIEGVQTVVASSGKMALDYCKNNSNIQVIISDSNMGEVSGREFLSNLKNHYETVPVFYLLTGAFDVQEEEIIREGGKGLISKPFDLNEILERIKKDIKF